VVPLLFLGGCSDGGNLTDLKQYVAELDSKYRGHVEPLPQLKPYETFAYTANALRNPFQPPDPAEPEIEPNGSPGAGIHPDFSRPKEPLEQFPLDTLRMVGTLEQNRVMWALISAADGTLYRVCSGNYLGQNHGKIVNVTELQVQLSELVPNSKGGWQEQLAAIELSEAREGGTR
jgi:type IV pilus assembly protein PilP